MIRVGTSGWQYDSWRGNFYPREVPKRAWLSHYVTRFPSVEVNNSFYQLPKEATFDKWREETPQAFEFVLKASRYITHIRRMRDAEDPVRLFWSRAIRLGHKLGPVLFQFPPNLQADTPLLSAFLAVLPSGMRPALEFRHHSWHRPDVFEALDRVGAAWVVADRPNLRAPVVVTGGWSYLRFHQGSEHHPCYGREQLAAWADRIAGLEVEDRWIFFNNDPLGCAPVDAHAMEDLLRQRGCAVSPPVAGSAGI